MPNRDHTWTAKGGSVSCAPSTPTTVAQLDGVSCEYTNQTLKFIGTITFQNGIDPTSAIVAIDVVSPPDSPFAIAYSTVAANASASITVEGTYSPGGELANATFYLSVYMGGADANINVEGAVLTCRVD